MLHFRRLVRPLIVLSVIATALALIPSTVAAQDIEVFEFSNEDDDADWEVRVTVRSLGGCDPDSGLGTEGYTSTWLDDNDDPGVEVLNLKVCNYVITAEARNEEDSALSGKVCQAELQWGDTITDADAQDELRTSDSDRDDSLEVAVQHKGGSNPRCYDTNIVSFRIDPDEVVEDLPRSARDSALEELAERAVEVTEFEVRVRPDDSRVVGTSCDLVLAFRMHGNGRRVEKPLQGIPEGVVCEFRATIFRAPAPFEETESRGVLFSTGDANLAGRINVDLSDQVVLPYARIGIIQDVTGSDNKGFVSYDVNRSCGNLDALPPSVVSGGGPGIYRLPSGKVVATLFEGRFTVHSPNFANFGPTANYLVAARSLRSTAVEGCSASVTISDVPDNCWVAGRQTQTLTWRKSRPFVHFDFEFDITCDGPPTQTSVIPDLPPPPPPPGTSTTSTTGGDSAAVVTADGEVRLVARKVLSGRIEFGLQTRLADNSWSARHFPARRFFPTDARVERWLVSSALDVGVGGAADEFTEGLDVRITARRLRDGKVEFGLEQRGDDGWGERQLPRLRIFPTDTEVGQWLASSSLDLDAG